MRDYLERIGLAGPVPADLAGLTLLHERHLATVPFENLSIHLGEPIVLTEEALLDKVVRRHRGGSATSSTAPSPRCCARSASR
jgi:N-hydroxyarylamine O-acetyltransferase